MDSTIANGSTVEIEYTLRDEQGEVLDTSEGRGPLSYVHGQQQIIPGLESALVGMRAGEARDVVVPPEDAYGVADPAAVAQVPRTALPPDALVPGTQLTARGPDGQQQFVRVKEIGDETVLLDLNHPLAGVTLYFAVKILSVS